jgi:L-2,4-diaminobutyrate decarboxylase
MTTKAPSLPLQKTQEAVSKLLVQYIESSGKRETDVLNQHPPEVINEALNTKVLFEQGFRSVEALSNFVKTYLSHTNHLHHPGYMGHQVAVPHSLSGIPDWIHGTINNPSSLYEMGPAGAALEGYMVHWMLDQFGWFKGTDYNDFKRYTDNGSGFLTHGGSIANLTALSAARAEIAPKAWNEGSPKDLVVMGPDNAHYSILRALSIMGMGKNSFVPVPVDENEIIDTQALESVYQKVKSEGKRVMAVVGNACATSTGLFDPLDKLADFCEQHHLWFHVDGAHGASAILVPSERHKVKGIERADSLIWDAHKMLRVPALCTAVLFRNQHHQWNCFHQKGSYVFHDSQVVGIDSMPFTIECTKSALGTKLYWSFALEGEQAIRDFIAHSFTQAKELYTLLQNHPDFYCPYPPASNILCFQYKPEVLTNQEQLALRYEIINSSPFYITSCEVKGKRYLRVVLLNPLTQRSDFIALIKAIQQRAEKGLG